MAIRVTKAATKSIKSKPPKGRGSSYNVNEDKHLCITTLSIS
jgi:hypothetical protein